MFEHADPKVLGAVRALARELRYQSLPSLVGRRVRIETIASIEGAVRAAVPELPRNAKLGNDVLQMGLSLGKYGLLDLRYEVASIEAPPLGFRGLGELELVDAAGAHAFEDTADGARELFAWLDECRTGAPLMRLFLEGPAPRDVVPGWRERGGFEGDLVADYLPRELTVTDACETNGAFVWLLRHFYL